MRITYEIGDLVKFSEWEIYIRGIETEQGYTFDCSHCCGDYDPDDLNWSWGCCGGGEGRPIFRRCCSKYDADGTVNPHGEYIYNEGCRGSGCWYGFDDEESSEEEPEISRPPSP
jgi:hypothetical protein